MKSKIPISFLLLIIGVIVLPVSGQTEDNDINLTIEFFPEPVYNQMIYNEDYSFIIKVNNIGLELEPGDITDSSLRFRFNGTLFVSTSFIVSKEGKYEIGGETIDYSTPLSTGVINKDVSLPPVGTYRAIPFDYTADRGYGKSVNIFEWITFEINVEVYLWEYRELEGSRLYHLGDRVSKAYTKFNIVSNQKIEYVNNIYEIMEAEIESAKVYINSTESQLNIDLGVDFSSYEEAYEAMGAHIIEGNYISAMETYSAYKPTWKEDMISNLVTEINAITILEDSLTNCTSVLGTLTDEYQQLQKETQAFTEEKNSQIEELNAQFTLINRNNRLLLFGIFALCIVLAYILYKIFR
jgi:hypothetical protein